MKGKFHPAEHDDLVVEFVPQVGQTDGELTFISSSTSFTRRTPAFRRLEKKRQNISCEVTLLSCFYY
ncbi:hypothetical protein MASR2M79_17330 [Aminivibrio sp.]